MRYQTAQDGNLVRAFDDNGAQVAVAERDGQDWLAHFGNEGQWAYGDTPEQAIRFLLGGEMTEDEMKWATLSWNASNPDDDNGVSR